MTSASTRFEWKKGLPWLVVLLLYVAIQACFWAPAWHEFRTQFIGEGCDNYVFVWNAWWLTDCLHHWRNPLFCNLQYAPFGTPLAFHCLTIIPALFIAGLSQLLSIQLAFNLVELGLCVLAGISAFALAKYITKDIFASAVGGAVFMLCPFMTSKLLGHMNLSCAAFLPLYTLCLLRAIEEPKPWVRTWLTLSFLLILFSSEETVVLAANITVWYWLFRAVRSGAWLDETKRFLPAHMPILGISAVWGSVLVYYLVKYQVYPERHGALASCPEPLNYLMPIHPLSLWRDWFAPAGPLGSALSNLELSTYLGWLVCPIALAGFWFGRRRPQIRLMTVLFIFALIISLGPRLQWHRQQVRLGGHRIHLPMELYQWVPLLGIIGQSGRYMVIAYMSMAVGVAGTLAYVHARLAKGAVKLIVSALSLAAICVDFGYRPVMVGTPASLIPPGAGRVMDARISPARSIYRQTVDGRALVGGYISRPPPRIQQMYRAMPGVGWFFQPTQKRGEPPEPAVINKAFQDLEIEYIWFDPGGREREALERAGWRVVYEDNLDILMSK